MAHGEILPWLGPSMGYGFALVWHSEGNMG